MLPTPLLNALAWDELSKFRIAKFGLKKQRQRSMVCCKVYFDILNRLSVTHECDKRIDGHSRIANAAFSYVARQKNEPKTLKRPPKYY